MTTKSPESKLYDLASKIVRHSWNKTAANAKIAFILSIIESGEGTLGLQKFLQKAKVKADDSAWSDYYGDSLEILLNDFFSLGFDEHMRYEAILTALHTESKDFNWHNAAILIGERLFSHIQDFNTDFRGNIVCIHRVGKHDIVETELELTGNSTKSYFPLCHVSMAFNKLEHALLYCILGNSFSRAAIALEQVYSDSLTNKI